MVRVEFGSSVSVVTRLQAGKLGIQSSTPSRNGKLHLDRYWRSHGPISSGQTDSVTGDKEMEAYR
jgi:hypothetical protein